MQELTIPYGRQYIDKEDIKSVCKVLNSRLLTSGPNVFFFEKLINKYCKSKFAVCANSATSALHIACMALGVKKGDYVWTSSISFVASANCAVYCGANVDLLDIDIDTFNLSPKKLEEKLKKTKKNKLPKVVIPVHMGGLSCDMKAINALAKKYKFKILEDASHALGGSYNQKKIGSCEYSNIAVFSFHPVKTITSAEGGVAVTNNKYLAENMRRFRDHGIERNPKKFQSHFVRPWLYEQKQIGYNYRLSDLHAALGISQLKKINKFIKKRNLISKYYINNLKKLPILFQKKIKNIFSSYHLFIILVSRNYHLKLFNFLRASKIAVNLHYIPIYFHPFFRKKFNQKDFPNSNSYYSQAISLPIFYQIAKKQQDYVIKKIKLFYKKNNGK
jgi:UDP-4-amino-4,6-dideoxy-N-acetyl-beta-L-altrosamine transaminase